MSGCTTNLVTVSLDKSVENNTLMNCVVTLLSRQNRCKFNPCNFLHIVSENYEIVNKIEDNLNYQLNIEQKSWKFMRNQEFLKGWKFHYKGKRNK